MPSSTNDTSDASALDVRLDPASVMTTDLEAATDFYVDLLGLTLRTIEDDPVREGRERAMLGDGRGRPVIELIEMPEMEHPSVPGRGASQAHNTVQGTKNRDIMVATGNAILSIRCTCFLFNYFQD